MTAIVTKSIASLVLLLLAEVLLRIGRGISEYVNYRKHYRFDARSKTVLKYVFTFSTYTKYLGIAVILVSQSVLDWKSLKELSFLIPVYVLVRYAQLSKNPFDTIDWIRSDTGLDYATGMASNYFHGYLNLNLPNRGDGWKGIRERMEDYEAHHNVKFAVKRLFILVSDSMHFKPKFESNYLTSAAPLEVLMKDRAGVTRPFRNDVYRFKDKINDSIYYISVEGATPLLSFYEAMHFKLTGTSEMHDMQREIFLKFYKSIKKITTNCLDLKMEVEIVYYNDYMPDGKPVDVGLVLRNHIEQMWAEGRD